MNIIICIKQVPNTTDVQIDPETGRLKREGVESIINPFDEYAIEEGVRIKEKTGGKVIVITMGPLQSEFALREAVSKGADEAVLISDRAFGGADTLATSYALSSAIEFIGGYDIILCGEQSSDGDTGQVGPEIAEMLNIPHIAYVKKIELIDDKSIKVERMMEDGCDLIESPLPALLTVVKGINTPRIASLKGKIVAKKVVIKILNAADVGTDTKKTGLNGSPTQVVKIFTPTQRNSDAEKFSGEAKEVAVALVKRLSEIRII
ncbi:electron transfer flavoprotein subunit beta/FixA family protein [Candidatus Endomicrobiellum trichonymphae]|uniref:electron transfer flavoprotein subunit beta/FixA family protein n=1 Tax=Endomicrobium trichonymphae TaxID=1408204 RepID=UPI000866467B|nr:electron transfer flavoprotein subunit beta/FixA family protein [Candidatus Endomicrobium trichonymphae]BAV59139.1 electron transfer flavoprotein subunit beta [Candidatus Endomicrobium trichonymphae]